MKSKQTFTCENILKAPSRVLDCALHLLRNFSMNSGEDNTFQEDCLC